VHRIAVKRDLSYGDQPEQRVDLYLQGIWTGEPAFFERASDRRPTLLFIHGGGWVVRDRSPEPWLYPFLGQGWHVVSMTYRLGPGTAPLAVDDAVCALQWITRNALEHGFDLDQVVVAGVSAGGHLALMAGTLGSRPGHACYPGNGFRVRSVINWFGITDIEAVDKFLAAANPVFGNYARAWIGDESRVAGISAAYSPVNVVDERSPPVLTIHGTEDQVVPFDQAVVLHQKLDALGVRNELLSLEGGTHAGFTDEQFEQAFGAMLGFVDAN
jgi:acetyl esterase/lipase